MLVAWPLGCAAATLQHIVLWAKRRYDLEYLALPWPGQFSGLLQALQIGCCEVARMSARHPHMTYHVVAGQLPGEWGARVQVAALYEVACLRWKAGLSTLARLTCTIMPHFGANLCVASGVVHQRVLPGRA